MRTINVLSTILLLALCVFLGCEQLPVNGPSGKAVVPESNSASLNKDNIPVATAPDGGLSLLQKSNSSVIPVVIAFANASGDNIQSDKRGSYTDQVDGVSAVIDPTLYPLVLNTDGNFKPTKGVVPRKLVFDLTHPENSGPSYGVQTVVAFLNVGNIYAKTSRARFNLGGLFIQFGVATDPLQVTANPDGTWTVTTTGTGLGELLTISKGKWLSLGNYKVPFSFTVTAKK